MAWRGTLGNGTGSSKLFRSCGSSRLTSEDTDSDWADDYRLDSFVADTEALIDWLDIGPVVIVGHSLGGAIGISLAARRPDLVNGLIVVDIGPEFPESAVAHVAARQGREDTFAGPASAAAALRAANPFPTDEAIHHRIAHGLTEAAPGRWTWRHDRNVERPLDAPALGELWDRWRQTTAPSLVVRGEHSPYLPGSLAERMAAARPGVRLNVVADAGHNVPTDQPTAFGSVVASWLNTTFNSSDT